MVVGTFKGDRMTKIKNFVMFLIALAFAKIVTLWERLRS